MITLTYSDNGLSVNLEQAPRVTGVQLQKWIALFVARVHSAVARNIGDGGLLGRRTGNLARSIRERISLTPDGWTGEIWPDPDKAIYGAIQEFGGTIIPKRARFLTIPLDAMLTANGVARGSARDVIASPQSFGFAGTFFHDQILFGKNKEQIIPLFVLKSSVVIPAHYYLETSLKQELSWGETKMAEITGELVTLIFGPAQ